ncbi:hypothetical protein [Alkalihalobacterium elongatum]|uniref:hypothetical protein n=1 Tax=Alkalihalobacterium elongatum TaxID=2675466 RepID=UPI001C1FED98|nr:hypothetical protein [Alkalihalobacterium elongatum]
MEEEKITTSLIKDLIPLMGVIVGGLLTILGALIQRWISDRKEKKETLRAKLEYMYETVDELSSLIERGPKSDSDNHRPFDASFHGIRNQLDTIANFCTETKKIINKLFLTNNIYYKFYGIAKFLET